MLHTPFKQTISEEELRMMRKVVLMVCIVMLVNSPAVFAALVNLPQTGQTTCYDETGAAIPDCTGTGQDGDYRAGVPWDPNTRFTVGTGTESDCITDNLTGLMWLRGPEDTERTWQEALDYANSFDRCGHTDWRVPNLIELESLSYDGQGWFYTAYWLNDQGFTNIALQPYWTSTTNRNSSTQAWAKNFTTGDISANGKTSLYRTFLVRGTTSGPALVWQTGQTTCYDETGAAIPDCTGTGQDGDHQAGVSWDPNTRFTPGTGTEADCVIDNLTGLMWVKAPGDTTRTWQEALTHANTIDPCGHTDWRVPNKKEQLSIINFGVANNADWLNTRGFSNVGTSIHWASTHRNAFPSQAWYIDVATGQMGVNQKPNGMYSWAVRGGIPAPLMTATPDALDFNNVLLNGPFPVQTVTITNSGTADLVVSSIEITGTSPTMFFAGTGATNGCALPNATVIPSASCTLDVTFTPDILGVQDALLYINSNDPDTPRVQVSLAGNGVMTIMNPLEGTTGSEITIFGSGFGDSKGKVLIGTASAKVTGWTNSRITCTVKKAPLPVGPFAVKVTTKSKQTIDITDSFTVKNPELDPLTDDNRSGTPEEEITLTGRFFGTKKGKVYLEYKDSKGQTKKKTCKVTYWNMIPSTGVSELRFIVPKISKTFTVGPHPLKIDNKIEIVTASEDFIVGLP